MIANSTFLRLAGGLVAAFLIGAAFAQSSPDTVPPSIVSSNAPESKSGLPLPKGWPMPTRYPNAQDLGMARIAYTLDAQKRGDKENYEKAVALIQWGDHAKAEQDNRRRQYLPKAIALAGQRAREHGRSYATPDDIQQALADLEAQGR
ncbi:hypothetical protein [Paraburkholderia sp. GAS32]|jgi:hypothetical protein|uniref:hypothetical protein n=1 Tax=Paraburkholderia sp. GAS32 TaxID=3035129 RepID=UPI003D249F5A